MTSHLHELGGCAPRPIASYLKALALLRLVGEQVDPSARGWWRGDVFLLSTRLSADELERFFLEDYAPTPTVSPWNKGSGFFKGDAPLKALEATSAPRFAAYRAGIADARAMLRELSEADSAVRTIKAEPKALKAKADKARLRNDAEYKRRLAAADRAFSRAKQTLLPRLRQTWRGPHLDWMSAAIVLAEDGPDYPPMLGTGGTDGRFDFTNNFLQRLAELFDLSGAEGAPLPASAAVLRGALWGGPSLGLRDLPIGQLAPGLAGGANNANGPSESPSVNPWELVFALEGAVVFAPAATRRLSAGSSAQLSTPFMVRSDAVGHGTASSLEDAPRGEQWLPLWGRPATLAEVRGLLAEGRAQLDRRGPRQPLELARAVARLSVARGLTSFERYGFLERNGQSTFAVSLGRVEVAPRPHARLVDDLAEWMGRLAREAKKPGAPARLKLVERRLADSVYEAVAHDHTAERWQAVLLGMADVEVLVGTGCALRAGPIPPLRAEWIAAADDGSPAVRLAVSLGLATAHGASGKPVSPVRHHLLPLRPSGRALAVREGRIVRDPRVVAFGRDPEGDLVAVLRRRYLEHRSGKEGGVAWRAPIVAPRGCSARLDDLQRLIDGHVDLDRCVRLSRAFMAIDRRSGLPARADAATGATPDDAWLCLRAALSPWPLSPGADRPPADLAIIERLASGDATEAVRSALRRLRALGLRPAVRFAGADAALARRWAAALVFPVSQPAIRRAVAALDPTVLAEKELDHVR